MTWILRLPFRVARWFVFKPKIPIWVHFGRYCNGKSLHILEPFGLFYGLWKYFTAIGYILGSLGIFPRFGVLYQDKSGNPASVFFAPSCDFSRDLLLRISAIWRRGICSNSREEICPKNRKRIFSAEFVLTVGICSNSFNLDPILWLRFTKPAF
jgi:hypothetical protein